MYKRIKTLSDTSCWSKFKKYDFALPIKSEKQKLAEAWYRDRLKFFKTLLNAFNRVYTYLNIMHKNQQPKFSK